MRKVEIDIEDYLTLLCERKAFVEREFGWRKMRDYPSVWEYFLERVEECGVSSQYASPSFVIDNLIVNGDYGSFDAYKSSSENDEEFAQRIQQQALFVDRKNRCVLISC